VDAKGFAACLYLAASPATINGRSCPGAFTSLGIVIEGRPLRLAEDHLHDIVTMALGALRLLLGITCRTKMSLRVAIEGLTFMKRHDNIEVMATMAALVLVHRGVRVAHRASPLNASIPIDVLRPPYESGAS
jgi:hypothetical protein